MNEVLKCIKARRSARVYSERQVAPGELDIILDAAVHAPSGMNLQQWHFTAIQDAQALVKLNDCVKAAFAKSDDPVRQERGHSDTYCCYYHAPTLVIVSGDASSQLTPFDCACALENIFLAATSLGVSSCWINQVGQTCDDPGMRAYLTELGVPENYRVYGCAALGYLPDDHKEVKQRPLAQGTINIVR